MVAQLNLNIPFGVGLIRNWERARTLFFTKLVSKGFARIGTGTRISPPFRFSNLESIILEENVVINRDCWLLTLESECRNGDAKLVIKSGARIGMGATISAAKSIVIGEHALLARNVYISDHAHAYERVDLPVSCQGIENVQPVSIGKHAWLGQNVCVLPGASVGDHCVIGANSVVLSRIPDRTVAVGCPARVVRRYNALTGHWERV